MKARVIKAVTESLINDCQYKVGEIIEVEEVTGFTHYTTPITNDTGNSIDWIPKTSVELLE